MKSPVFVVGIPRSGTTLLTNILDRHPGISVYFESSFLLYVSRTHKTGLDDRVQDVDDAVSNVKYLERAGLTAGEVKERFLKTDRTYRSMFDTALRLRMEKQGKKRFGEKSPSHFLFLDLLFRYYPDARVIFVSRDPRSVYSSYKYRRRVLKQKEWKPRDAFLRPLFWNLLMAQMQKYRSGKHSDQIMSVRFEDIVSRPEETVRGICDFIGEEYHEEMISVENSNSSFEGLTDKSGIRKEALDRVSHLSRGELLLIELICGNRMLERGYDTMVLPGTIVRLLDRMLFYSIVNRCYSVIRNARFSFSALPRKRTADIFSFRDR